MALAAISKNDLGRILAAVHGLLKIPAKRFWVDYDADADVLYLSFRRPQGAGDSEMRDDGVIVRRYRGDVVGLTILDASKR